MICSRDAECGVPYGNHIETTSGFSGLSACNAKRVPIVHIGIWYPFTLHIHAVEKVGKPIGTDRNTCAQAFKINDLLEKPVFRHTSLQEIAR